MSEEVAASIGDVLAENERLKQQVAQQRTAIRTAQDLADHYRELADRRRGELETAQRQLRDASGTAQAMIDILRSEFPAGFRGDNPVWACGKLVDHIADLKGQLESAQASGDPWRECERLRALLAQAEERARIASAAYHQQQDATREHEARYQAMTERALAAEQDNAALRIAVRRQTEARDETLAINRELNGQLLAAGAGWSTFWEQQAHEGDVVADKLVEIAVKHHTNYAAALDTARRLVVAWRAERAERIRLDILREIAVDDGAALSRLRTALAELLNESEGA